MNSNTIPLITAFVVAISVGAQVWLIFELKKLKKGKNNQKPEVIASLKDLNRLLKSSTRATERKA